MSRIQHAEDLIFWDGTAGVKRVINSFEKMSGDLHKNISLKWDGSPAVIFGVDERGEFIFTDKSGFSAKGYDGKVKSDDQLKDMLLKRVNGEIDDSRKSFISNMKNAFNIFKSSFPKNLKGYFTGDILYLSPPAIKDGNFTFKPNIVRYEVKTDSELGNKISKSKVGIVIHKYIDLSGNESSASKISNKFQGSDLLVIPPIFAKEAPNVNVKDMEEFSMLKRLGNNSKIDEFLDSDELTKLKIKNLPDVLYAYTNNKVDSGFENLGTDFMKWLLSKNVSRNKVKNISTYIEKYKNTFDDIWSIVTLIHEIKVKIIDSLENQDSWPVKSYIGDKAGGEGFVLSDKSGHLKLVSRKNFSIANRSARSTNETMEETMEESFKKLLKKSIREMLGQSNKMNINEGGNVFSEVEPFKKEEASVILNSVQSILPNEITLIIVGSAGKKDMSGDMDVMTDAEILQKYFKVPNVSAAKQELKKYLVNKNFESKVIGNNVHIKVPVEGTDRFAQVDVMVIEDASTISKYHIHDYTGTKYKGKDKHIIMSSLAKYTVTKKHPDGFVWSPFAGLKDRNTKKIITKDLDLISKILLSNKKATSDDIKSVESILLALKDKSKLKDAIDTLKNEGRPIEI